MAALLILLATLCLQGTLAQEVSPFRDPPANTSALTNTPITLTCSAPDPSPPPSIIWLHDNIFAGSTGGVIVTYNAATGVSEYMILSVSYYDAGAYQCLALSTQGEAVSFSEIGILTVQGHPAFAQLLSPVTVPIGGEAVFQCQILSNPPATVVWLYGQNGQPVVEDERISLTPSSLVIQEVQESDAGYYECRATNAFGLNSTSAPLTIGVPPATLEVTIFPNQPNPYTLSEGVGLLLRCTVSEGAEIVSIAWLKDFAPVTVGVSMSGDDLLLSIAAIQVEDGGMYSCVATDDEGISDSATLIVEVYIPPLFTESPNDITLEAGPTPLLTEIFRCQATGIPEPVISWEGPDGEPIPLIGFGGDIVPNVWASGIRREDAGVYTCVASNAGGVDRTGFTVTVEAAALITTPPSDTEAGYGQDVVFTCTAVGPPEPNITWTKTGGTSQLPEGAVMAAMELHIFSVTEEDNGTYQCLATNRLGSTTAAALLTVLDLPRVSSISPEVVSIEIGQSFSLQCVTTGPPSTITSWYHNRTLVPQGGGDPRVQSSSGSLTVAGAVAGDSGEYTCNASTSYAYDVAHITVTVGSSPTIPTPPLDSNLLPEANTFLQCGVAGLPPPHVTWYKTDELGIRTELPIVGGTFVVYTDGIQFTGVKREDSGEYECVAENVIGQDQASARLRVEGYPQATNITPLVIIAGDPATLTCETVYNFPPATIVWSRSDGAELDPRRFSVGTDGTLRVAVVEVEDETDYKCRAINSYGDSNVTAFVTVHVHPTISFPPSSLPFVIILHSSGTLLCPTEGRPTPTISWYLPNGSPPSGDRYQVNEATGQLVIVPVVVSDGGVYTCLASNIVGSTSMDVTVEVKGAAPTSASVITLSSSVLVLTWDPPPAELSSGLQSYRIEQRDLESHDSQVIQHTNLNQRQYIGFNLERGTTYEFAIRGVYSDGIVGVDFVTSGRTLEEPPSGPPRNVSLQPVVLGLNVSWLPPDPNEDNGLIILYRLHYRLSQSDSSVNFTLIELEPTSNDTEERQRFELANLLGGRQYEVTIQAENVEGIGPSSTIARATTLEPETSSDVVPEILAIVIPLGSILAIVVTIFTATGCVWWWRRRQATGKHSPLMEDMGFQEEQRRRRGKHMHRTITGPVPGITPNIDTSVPGKFTIQSADGTFTSTNPTVITPEDVAPPPFPGQTVPVVPRAQIIQSQQHQGYDEGEEWEDEGEISPYASVNWNRPDIRTQPILEEEEGSWSSGSSDEGGGLSASRNTLDLSNPNLAVLPSSEDNPTHAHTQGGQPAPDTGQDDSHLLYATVPQNHRVVKRAKMLQDQQKREIKARQDQRKMQEKMRRDQKKKEAKSDRTTKKERKRREKLEAAAQERRERLGLGNVLRLHEVDPSSQQARAQAQFIDAATAAIF